MKLATNIHHVSGNCWKGFKVRVQMKGSVQEPDNFHFHCFDVAIFVTNIRKKCSSFISLELDDHGQNTLLSAQCISSIGQIIKSVCVSVSQSVSE